MNDMTPDPLRDLIDDYVLELLEPAERAAFEARLADDAALRAEVAAAREALTTFALSAPVAPPPSLKERVMDQVRNERPAPRPASRPDVLPLTPRPSRAGALWLTGALAASMALLVKLSFDLRGADRERADAVEALARQTRTVAQRDSLLADRDTLIARLTAPGVELVTLAATGDAKPTIRVYLDRRRRTALLTVAALEPVPSDQAYQLWFIVGGKPVPSATFTPDAGGTALVDVAFPEGSTATAITREPRGGSPAPTSTPIFAGTIAGR